MYAINKTFLLPVIFFLILFAQLSAELESKAFYLGLNPDSKSEIINDMLSSKGKLFRVNTHSILVRDTRAVLEKINNLLEKKDIALNTPQVRINIKKDKVVNETKSFHDIKFESAGGGKGTSVSIGSGTKTGKLTDNQVTQIAVLSGKTAEIALTKTDAELAVFRDMFLDLEKKEIVSDGVIMKVKPIVGKYVVLLEIQTEYRALVGKKRKSFAVEKIATNVSLKPGQWLKIGGSSRISNKRNRRNLILSADQVKIEGVTDISLMVEIIKLR